MVLKEPVKVTRLGNLKDILSGKKTVENPSEPIQEFQEEEISASAVAEPANQITFSKLSAAIEQLAIHLESQDKKSAAAALRLNGHHLREGVAYLELMKHEMVIFVEIKTEVLQFIRNATGYSTLPIEFEMVLKARKDAKPFRAKDKLDAMIKKNPLMQNFMDAFDLELDD